MLDFADTSDMTAWHIIDGNVVSDDVYDDVLRRVMYIVEERTADIATNVTVTKLRR